jgi:thiol-disulfide isomerase/thioredoxin
MLNIWHQFKGYVVAGVALVACPCHLPLTLPIFLALTAGTALGGWVAANTTLIYITFGVLFAGGLVLASKWLMFNQPAAIPKSEGPANVVLVSSRTCSSCADTAGLWESLRQDYQFRFQKVDITSGKGRSLAAKYNILSTPTTLVNGQVAFRGVPNRRQAVAAVKS